VSGLDGEPGIRGTRGRSGIPGVKGDVGRKGSDGRPGQIGDAGPPGTPVSSSWSESDSLPTDRSLCNVTAFTVGQLTVVVYSFKKRDQNETLITTSANLN